MTIKLHILHILMHGVVAWLGSLGGAIPLPELKDANSCHINVK